MSNLLYRSSRASARSAVEPRPDGSPDGRSYAASVFLHLAVLAALLVPFWLQKPELAALPAVTLVIEDPGSSGASGGTAGGGGAASPSQQTAEATTAAAEPEAAPARPETPTQALPETPAPLPVPSPAAAKPPPKAKPKPKPKPKTSTPVRAPAAPAPPSVQQAEAQRRPLPGAAGPTPGPGSAAMGHAGEGVGGPGGAGRGVSGAGRGALGEGADGLGDEYLERLRRWLAKHKTQPRDPKPGTVLVDFTIARDGRVLDARIDRSSGVPELDALALKIFRDASPVPPLPANYTMQQARLVLPINYKVGLFVRLFGD